MSNNPPAFPIHWENHHQGMSLRDYMAARAMQGYSSDPDWRQDMTPTDTAFAAYKQADEMLKERGREE